MLLIHLHCFKLQAQRPRIEEDKKFSNTPPEQESRNLQDTNFFIKYKNGISISILLANNQEHTSQTKILLKQQQSNHKTLWSIIWSKHNTTPPKPRICSSKATKLVLKMVTTLTWAKSNLSDKRVLEFDSQMSQLLEFKTTTTTTEVIICWKD